MKYLPIFTLIALSVLYVAPDTRADTTQVAGVTAISVPAPIIAEAINGELDLRLLNGADATVELAYPDVADGHTVGLFWTSNIQQYRAPVQTVSGGARSVIFKIPNATVSTDLGQTPKLTASVGIGGNPLVISAPLDIKVVNSTPAGDLPQPVLPGSPDNQVDIGALAGDLVVSVHYPTIDSGQIVQVLWEGQGVTPYSTPLRITPDANPIQFTIPNAVVVSSLGKPVILTYKASLDGQEAVRSDPAPLHISLQTLPDAPTVPSAGAGQIDLRNLSNRDLAVTYTYPGIATGHTAGIRWAGTPVYDTPHPPIGATPRPLQFTIPYSKVKQEKGKTVDVTASVGVGDGKLAVSPKLSVEIVDTRPTGEQVAADLNARFEDTRATCDNNRPSYYCNGVTTRGTANGNFDPWDPSTTQRRKGSVSFSYIRKDSKVTYLWQNSGYVFLSGDEANQQNLLQEYLCVFPHDGATDIGRLGYGCGFAPTTGRASNAADRLVQLSIDNPRLFELLKGNEEVTDRLANGKDASDLLLKNRELADLIGKVPELRKLLQDSLDLVEASKKASINVADPSTCAGKAATELNSWHAFTQQLTHRVQQCSLSTQSAAQFAVAIQARALSVPTSVFSTWNELLIKVWAAGIPARLPLQAFYYQNATGLPEAKVYQQKYASRTGGLWLPIIKLDATKLAGGVGPFSYNTADQAIQQ